MTEPVPSGTYNATADLVDRHVNEGRGNRRAFVDHKSTLTYGDLQAQCNRFANALGKLGVTRESRIVLIMHDTVDLPVAFLGAIKAGVVPIPLNTLLPPETWRYMIEDSAAAAVVVSEEIYDSAAHFFEEIAQRRTLHIIVTDVSSDQKVIGLHALLNTCSPQAAAADTHADDTAFWLYSSGSTGAPKGTRHVHASLMMTARLFGHGVLGLNADDVIFSAAKLYFAYGLGNGLSFPLSVGATAVLMPDRPTPDSVAAVLRKHHLRRHRRKAA